MIQVKIEKKDGSHQMLEYPYFHTAMTNLCLMGFITDYSRDVKVHPVTKEIATIIRT